MQWQWEELFAIGWRLMLAGFAEVRAEARGQSEIWVEPNRLNHEMSIIVQKLHDTFLVSFSSSSSTGFEKYASLEKETGSPNVFYTVCLVYPWLTALSQGWCRTQGVRRRA